MARARASIALPAPRLVGASTFGGPGDPGTGSTGYRGTNLNGTYSYAELSKSAGALDFSALGGLPEGQAALVRNPLTGRQAIAYKNDVGAGGGPVSYKGRQLHRSFDAWYELAHDLGASGLFALEFTPLTRAQAAALKAQGVPDRPGAGTSKTPSGATAPSSSSAPATLPQSSTAADIFGADSGHTLIYALLFVAALGLGAGLTVVGVNRMFGGAPGRLAKDGVKTATTAAKVTAK